jgi:hypothetical protein
VQPVEIANADNMPFAVSFRWADATPPAPEPDANEDTPATDT